MPQKPGPCGGSTNPIPIINSAQNSIARKMDWGLFPAADMVNNPARHGIAIKNGIQKLIEYGHLKTINVRSVATQKISATVETYT